MTPEERNIYIYGHRRKVNLEDLKTDYEIRPYDSLVSRAKRFDVSPATIAKNLMRCIPGWKSKKQGNPYKSRSPLGKKATLIAEAVKQDLVDFPNDSVSQRATRFKFGIYRLYHYLNHIKYPVKARKKYK